jgi:hypothetical protein
MAKTVTVYAKVRLDLKLVDGVDPIEAVEEMEYSFEPGDGCKVLDTEIVHVEELP